VLLDENLDHALRKLLGQHEVVTVTYMGWAGFRNGETVECGAFSRKKPPGFDTVPLCSAS
jgi:hypothetical protein